ncbi:right-handed parallel beta-helix repeat-containing protein [Methanobrevibacter sp.]
MKNKSKLNKTLLINQNNCNFTDNHADYGGALYFEYGSTGTVTNCNFTNNEAYDGGAVYFVDKGTVENCNFTDNEATYYGGAIWMYSGNVENCNFTNNQATYYGGAVYFYDNGNVSNCNFTNNQATYEGGAIWMSSGSVENCNFTNNSARYGGAVCFYDVGNVTNCNFVDNSANRGGAIYSNRWYTAADTCIFKGNSGEDVNIVIYPPTLNVDNFTTFYGSDEKLTFDLRTNLTSIPVTNGHISISVYFKDNDSWVRNYTCLSGEEWTVDLPVGSYYAIFDTEYEKFQPINRTITITVPNVKYYINVTSLTTNNKTVNITAKSDIPKDILWDGKLLFY